MEKLQRTSTLSAMLDKAAVVCCVAWVLLILVAAAAKILAVPSQLLDVVAISAEIILVLSALKYFHRRWFTFAVLSAVSFFAVWHLYRNFFLVSNKCICFGSVLNADIGLLVIELASLPVLTWGAVKGSNRYLSVKSIGPRLVFAYGAILVLFVPILEHWSDDRSLAMQTNFSSIRSVEEVTNELIENASQKLDPDKDYVFVYVSKHCSHCRNFVLELANLDTTIVDLQKELIPIVVEVDGAELDWPLPAIAEVYRLPHPILIAGSLPALGYVADGIQAVDLPKSVDEYLRSRNKSELNLVGGDR